MGYYPPPGQQPGYPQQPYYPQDSTDTVAMILEILFGLFGLMGMGWLYAGNILTAILVFIGFTVFLLVEAALIAITGGLCGCLALPVNIAVAVISGMRVRDYVRRTRSRGSVLLVVIAGLIGFMVIAALVVGLIFLIISLGLVSSMSFGDLM